MTLTGNPDFEGKPSYGFTVVATDAAGNATEKAVTLGILNVDEAPSGTDKTLAVAKDASHTFSVADFGFSDIDGNAFTELKITALPTSGTLLLNNVAVIAGQSIAVGSLGLLTWTPAPNAAGPGASSFTFQVVDNGSPDHGGQNTDQSPNTITFDLPGVNQPPTGPLVTPTVPIQAGLTQAALGLTALVDPEGDTLTYTVTTLPGQGTVFLGGTALTNGQELTQTEFLALTYSAPQTAGTHALQFDVSDITNNHTAYSINLNVTAGTNDVLIGTAVGDRLDGGAGNDILNGVGSGDMMIGGTGNDIYYVDSSSDFVNETGASGNDRVLSYISFSLANTARVLGTVENLTLLGNAVANATGNSLANVIGGNSAANNIHGGAGDDTVSAGGGNDVLYGETGKDMLNGGVGNDTIYGGVGNDGLVGGAGNDIFVFNTAPNVATNRDTIMDFVHGQDHIYLENAIFTKLAVNGVLNAANFKAGAAAGDANDYIIYNHSTGALYYDTNGNGAGGMTLLATLSTKPLLTASDFAVI